MDISAALALVAATTILAIIPGPNVALIVANTLARGLRCGVVTVMGTTAGIALQLALFVLGFSALLTVAGAALVWIKWTGVAYLIYLGVQNWRRGAAEMEDIQSSTAPMSRLFWQGAMLATLNPKVLLFNAAFLPQFLPSDASGVVPLLIPAAIYLAVLLCVDLLWAASANTARPALMRLGRMRHRLTGGLFIGAGVGLALAKPTP